MLGARHGRVPIMLTDSAEPPVPVVVAAPQAATSAELPVGARELIEAALASGNPADAEAVIRAARHAYPGAAEAIDRQVAEWKVARGMQPVLANAKAAAKPQEKTAEVAKASTTKVTGEGEAGAFANSGNAPGIGLVGGFKLLAEGPDWRVAAAARADYQEADNVVTREQYRVSAEPNYKFSDRGYVYGLGQYEQDRFQGFSSRYSLSGGLGYSVLKAEGAKLSIKAGPAWRVTNVVDAERESVLAGLASLEAKFRITPSLEYSQDASAYVDARGSTFYTLAALDSRLIGKLKARLSYMVQHETAPEEGRLGTDTTSRLTLVYGF
jgi:putative salt-induced outer membrane protein